jgi:hypothetical protein
MFEKLKRKNFQILTLHHAEAILEHDMAGAVTDLEEVLDKISLPAAELVLSGGGEGELTQRIRKDLSEKHEWKKHSFEIIKTVDGKQKESITHEIDHVKIFSGFTFALEIEWNNKDPFFDRDLENYKRLHADGVISVGAIITRGVSLQENLKAIIQQYAKKHRINSIDKLSEFYTPTPRQKELIMKTVKAKGSFEEGWANSFVQDKFGESTTHWRKLEDRVSRGVGNPCPLLLIGIPKDVVTI